MVLEISISRELNTDNRITEKGKSTYQIKSPFSATQVL